MVKVASNKTKMREQPPEERIRNFEEVPYGYSMEEAVAEANRCIQCKKPSCVQGCPVEINIPEFIRLIKEGDLRNSIRVLKETNVLPAVCGRVCPQEEQCEKYCILAKKMEPVAIGRLERFAADWEAQQGDAEIPRMKKPTGKRVAVVGTGPAGITVAGDLIQLGIEVTMYEALHEAGGVLVYGIPEFRLPKRIVAREIAHVCRMGVKLIKNVVIGTSLTVDDLLKEYDAVFIGSGAGLPWFMEIPGENLNNIYSANEYLTRANLMKAYRFPEYDTPIAHGKVVTTIGGGNVAMDSARTALRLGAKRSIVIYRRSRNEMPARDEEIHHAEEEGIVFHFLTNPVAYHGDALGMVQEVECLRMELGEPDSSGRRRPIPIEGSNFRIPVDVVVVSIGNSPNPLIPNTTPGLETGKWGNIIIDEETGRTSKKGVFAGGDVASGAATVISAMGAGKKAAKSILQYLRDGKW
ncbi:NADPH-dependent glutamate synthase [bacterium]|nr:NADPH-dependent glutamate synthase [bacterium]